MSTIQPPGGLLELPGMKGTIQIHYDLTRGMVNLEVKNVAFANLIQILLLATQGAVGQWAQAEAGIIRPKGNPTDGNEKKDDDKNNG